MNKRRRPAAKLERRRQGWRPGPQWTRRVRLGAIGATCVAALALSGCALAAGWQWFKSHPYFALANVEVSGHGRLDRDEVLRWAGVREGSSVWDAAPRALRMRLLGHPWIRHASVHREFPRRVSIRLKERRPAAIVRWGALQYVDSRGRVLGPLRQDDSRDFPVITGLDDAEAAVFAPMVLHRASRLLRWCERVSCFDAVSEVHVDRHLGVTVFPLRTTVAVVLGWGSWREKLARSARVLAAWEGQVERLAAVDASFRNLVVVKLREDHHPAVVRSARRGLRV